jgi:hypothetical protein
MPKSRHVENKRLKGVAHLAWINPVHIPRIQSIQCVRGSYKARVPYKDAHARACVLWITRVRHTVESHAKWITPVRAKDNARGKVYAGWARDFVST